MSQTNRPADALPVTPDDERVRGSNQSGLRAHNERAVLSLIRRHGALAKADIARLSGLSPQTASVLMRHLEAEELVLAGVPRRGRVGQPSVPMRLNADGAFSLGLKIGRRTSEMVLMDFLGTVRGSRAITYRFPRFADVVRFAGEAAGALATNLAPAARDRITGLGVATPFEIWSWGQANGAPAGEMEEWRLADIGAAMERATGCPVFLGNDATAACAAEQAFGRDTPGDYVYFFVGAFVGGGVVIDGSLVSGRSGNAGALGSMPVPRPDGGFHQLIHAASIHVLEAMVERTGGTAVDLWRHDATWTDLGDLLDAWIAGAAAGLAHAAVAAACVYDFEAAVIEGSFPPHVRGRLAEATRARVELATREGLAPFTVREGTIGRGAREVGAASLPFFAKYLLDHRVLYAER